MENKLENFITQNKEAFDLHEPCNEVWKQVKRNAIKNRQAKFTWVKYVAAILIFAVGFSLGNRYNSTIKSERIAKIDNQKLKEQTQLIESEYYYVTKINDRLNELEPFFASDPQLKHDIDIDFEELDAFYKQLKTDLNDDINNQHVIEAMIQSYKMKLDLLETLLNQLKQNCDEQNELDI